MAGPNRKKLLGQILKEMRLVHEGQVQEALQEQKQSGKRIGEILVEAGYVEQSDLFLALGKQAGLAHAELDGIKIPEELISRMDAATVNIFRIVPFAVEAGVVKVAIADPTNLSCLDDVRFMLGQDLEAYVAKAEEIDALINAHFLEREEDMDSLIDSLEGEIESGKASIDDQESLAQSTPVVKLLNYVLFMAIRDKASDIHLEPFEDEFKIRYRIDGVLFELRSPPVHLATALISRVKVMADLDIAETRIPQDGRIDLMVGGRKVDIRVSTLPTMYGESCVMRVLDKSVVNLDVGSLGFKQSEIDLIHRLIELPHGIILVTGPTGSGKTTTLYAALNEADREKYKIITTEDPVEYELPDIVQVQVNEDIGVTYSACLRTILRQDPDKILVGEIRDRDTAQIAVEASLTGHVVFSTLHTNDAPSAITRLVDIGVEPFLIAATLEAIIAQRLVRTICDQCKQAYEPPLEVLQELELTSATIQNSKFFSGAGCEHCYGTGYRGRMALFEIMSVTDELKEGIIKGVSVMKLADIAKTSGMTTLRDAGLRAIFEGKTTPEEVMRETVFN